jgi:MYXO-CTERM domain-containing protein
MRFVGVVLPLLIIAPLAACYQYGELGNLGFTLGIADPLLEFESGDRVLVGTRLCAQLGFANFGIDEGHLVDPSNEHCFSETLTGPVQVDAEECWTLDEPGEVVWEWTPTQLDDCEPTYMGDRMVFDVAAPTGELRLGFDDWRLRVPIVFGVDPQGVVGLAPGRTLADLREDPGAERRVFAGQLDTPMLRLDDDLGRLFFADADVAYELIGEGAAAVEPYEPVDPEELSAETRKAGERPLTLDPDALARIRTTLPGGLVVESPELIAVPLTDASSLDLVVMLYDLGSPAFAYAEVRDEQDRVLHAAPIEWDVTEGALAVYPGNLAGEARSGEYAQLGAECLPPSETVPVERHAVLRARLGDLEDSVELTWIEQPVEPDDDDLPFEADEECMFADDEGDSADEGNDEVGEAGDDPGIEDDRGCACSSEPDRNATGPAWLALAALLFVRRRRD